MVKGEHTIGIWGVLACHCACMLTSLSMLTFLRKFSSLQAFRASRIMR